MLRIVCLGGKYNSLKNIMGLIVDSITFYNRVPLGNIELRLIRGVNVLSGLNGCGKTTIMSYVVDAIYEMSKRCFPSSFTKYNNEFYRICSDRDLIDPNKPSIVYIRFLYDGEFIDYVNYCGKITKELYEQINLPDKPIKWSKLLTPPGKLCEGNKDIIDKALNDSIYTYFPAYRYERPLYLNPRYEETNPHFTAKQFYTGRLKNPIEVITGVGQMAEWILDVALDWFVYKNEKEYIDASGNTCKIDMTLENILWHNICEVISYALYSKLDGGIAAFALGHRNEGVSRVSIIRKKEGEKNKLLSPSISLLSSGEKELLCIFGEILRQADRIKNNIQVNEITGLVVIDEIDKHLHIKLQKESLPRLLNSFCNLQFIVSSHSPFFNMGMADNLKMPCRIFDLDNGGMICEPRNNDLYQQVYEMMLNDQTFFAQKVSELEKQVLDMTKPVILTEGITDIIHIQKAKKELSIKLEYDIVDEHNQPQGDGDLLKCLKYLSRTPRVHKIIGIFDCDSDTTKEIIEPYVHLGNQVYAFKIKSPQERIDKGQSKISIEYLYSDDEIKTILSTGKRLYFGTEFSDKTGLHKINTTQVLANQSGRGKDKILENTGGQAVYDNEENNLLATKKEFAEEIANDKVNISNSSWENFRHIFDLIEDILSE